MGIAFHGAILHCANFFELNIQHIEALATYLRRIIATVTGYASVVLRAVSRAASRPSPHQRVRNFSWNFIQ